MVFAQVFGNRDFFAVIGAHLDVFEFGLCFPGAYSDAANREVGSDGLGVGLLRLQYACWFVLGKQTLNVVGGGSVDLGLVEVDEVWVPCFIGNVCEEGGIACHGDDVGIAFHSHHEGCLADGTDEVS